jgi:hypothetical protein
MTYSQGGLIAATDYNSIVGTSPSSTANQINTVWAVGNGQYGYGQTALSQVSSTGLVTATQWASAINTLNSIRTHQSGSGTGISAPTSGSLVAYLSSFQTGVNSAYTNALAFNSQGSTTTGSVFSDAHPTAGNDATYSGRPLGRNITFSSGNAARYFFNAGGQINLVITSVNSGGSGRSNDMATLIGTNLGGVSAFRATTNGGRTGSGGTVTTNNTSFGYYNLTTSLQTTQYISSTSGTYTSDWVKVEWQSNGVQGSNADVGSVITVYLELYSAHSTGFDDAFDITINHRIDVVYPESTNLSNSWGTVTIS